MPTGFSISESNTLLQSLIASQDEQRDELGRELHNNVNQLLASARLLLEMAREDAGPDGGMLEKGLQCLNQAISEIRKITQTLNTAAVEDIGIEAAIRQLLATGCGRKPINASVDYDARLNQALTPSEKLMVYRIIQEQLQNIYRYADAAHISVTLIKAGPSLYFSITDDGRGFHVSQPRKGMGLLVIQNRVAAFNGIFRLHAAPGKGCRLEIELPLQVLHELR